MNDFDQRNVIQHNPSIWQDFRDSVALWLAELCWLVKIWRKSYLLIKKKHIYPDLILHNTFHLFFCIFYFGLISLLVFQTFFKSRPFCFPPSYQQTGHSLPCCIVIGCRKKLIFKSQQYLTWFYFYDYVNMNGWILNHWLFSYNKYQVFKQIWTLIIDKWYVLHSTRFVLRFYSL